MKYTKPEVEITELEMVDVIQTSSGEPDPGDNGTPITPFSIDVPTL